MELEPKKDKRYASARQFGCMFAVAIFAGIIILFNFFTVMEHENEIEELSQQVARSQTTVARGSATASQASTPPPATNTAQSADERPNVQKSIRRITLTPTHAPPIGGPTYDEVCEVSGLTEVQKNQHAESFIGQYARNWEGYVYDVAERNGKYSLELAPVPSGMLWVRSVEIPDAPASVVVPLNIKQRVVYSGRITAVNFLFGALCNPLIIEEATINPQ